MGLFYKWFLDPSADLDPNANEDWDEKRASGAFCIIHPEAPFRKFWDIGSVFMIIYSCVTVPYFLCLNAEAEGLTALMDRVVDILFMIDIGLCFITAQWKEDEEDGVVLVTKMGEIATNYAKGWFFPDFISSFPFDLVISFFVTGGPSPEAARIAKLIRMARMVKILRMVRIKRLLAKLQYALGLKNGAVDIMQFLFLIAIAAHFNACLWYTQGNNERPVQWLRAYCIMRDITAGNWSNYFTSTPFPVAESWMPGTTPPPGMGCLPNNYTLAMVKDVPFEQILCVAPKYTLEYEGSCGLDYATGHHMGKGTQSTKHHSPPPCVSDGSCDEPWTMWATAFYWSIVTMTTVGYGDVLPQNHDEREYCMASMTLSAILFAFAITSICTFIINLNKNEVFTQNRFDNLLGLLNTLKVERLLERRCIDYFNYLTGDDCQGAFYSGETLTVEMMRTELQLEVGRHAYHKFMERVPMMKSMSPELFADVARHLRLGVAGPGDEICVHSYGIATEMILLGRGRMEVRDDRDRMHEEHNWFGTSVLFGTKKYPSTVLCTDFADIYALPAIAFKFVLDEHDLSVAQFEHDLMARGNFEEEPEYMSLYDDWKPKCCKPLKPYNGEVCLPKLGEHIECTADDFDRLMQPKGGFQSKVEEHAALVKHAAKQRAFIGVRLIKRKCGHSGKLVSVEDIRDRRMESLIQNPLVTIADRRDMNMFSPVPREGDEESAEGGMDGGGVLAAESDNDANE